MFFISYDMEQIINGPFFWCSRLLQPLTLPTTWSACSHWSLLLQTHDLTLTGSAVDSPVDTALLTIPSPAPNAFSRSHISSLCSTHYTNFFFSFSVDDYYSSLGDGLSSVRPQLQEWQLNAALFLRLSFHPAYDSVPLILRQETQLLRPRQTLPPSTHSSVISAGNHCKFRTPGLKIFIQRKYKKFSYW